MQKRLFVPLRDCAEPARPQRLAECVVFEKHHEVVVFVGKNPDFVFLAGEFCDVERLPFFQRTHADEAYRAERNESLVHAAVELPYESREVGNGRIFVPDD